MNQEVQLTGRFGQLHGQLWYGARPPKGVVLIIHGLGDHGGRYQALAESMVARGWCVYAIDLPGHGRSPGARGRVDSFRGLLGDIEAACQTMADRFPGLPLVVLGCSMGGNLVLNYLLRCPPDGESHRIKPAGLVLCAPMLLPPAPPPRPHIFAAWMTGYLMPWIPIQRAVDVDLMTRDVDQAEQIISDPWMHSRITLYFATQLLCQGRWALDHARNIDVPVLIMYGEDDSMIDRGACEHLAIRAGEWATLHRWPQRRHDLFHDTGFEEVQEGVSVWLQRRFD